MTSYAETFNTADSSTLGPVLTWTELQAGWAIVSNVAYADGGAACLVRAEHDLATNNAWCEVVVPANDSGTIGPTVRQSASADTFYFTDSHGTETRVWKAVAGSYTALGSATPHAPSFPWTNRLEASGSTLKCYTNGAETINLTDSSIDGTTVGGKRFGIRGYSMLNGMGADSLSAADLSANHPVVAATTEGGLTAAGTSLPVTLPAGGASTDEYLVIVAKGSIACTINALTDWTELRDENLAGGMSVIRYTGTGVPSDPTFVQNASSRSVWCAYRITGADKTTAPEVSTVATGTSTTPDPSSRAVTGGPKDVLAIACFSITGAVEVADTDILVTAFPANYTAGQVQKTGGTSGTNLAGGLGAAARQVTTASEDPGTFTQNASRGWRAQTIVVHPAPAALNLSATGGAATASGGTVALAATWTAATGVATAAGGVATASSAAPPVDLSAAAGLATAAGGVVTLARTSVAAAGAATAAGGTVVFASVRVAASGVATAAGGTVALATLRVAAAGVATAGGGTVTLAASLVAAGGTSAATGGAATATVGASVTAANGVATAAGGTVLLSRTLLATSGVAVAGGGTVSFAKAYFFSAAGGTATAAGGTVNLSQAVFFTATAGVSTAAGGTVNVNIGAGVTVTAANGLATAGGGTLTQARQHVAAAGVASASGGVVTAGAGAALSAANGLASAAGGTVNLTVGQLALSATGGTATATGTAPALSRTHPVTAGTATATGGAVDIAAAGTVNVSAVSGASSATGGLVVGTWRYNASGGAAAASGGTVVRTSLAAGGVANATGGAVAARLVYTSTGGLAHAAGGTVDAAGAAFIPFGLIEGFGSSAATVDGSAASSVTGSAWGLSGTVDGTGTTGTTVDGAGGVSVLVE